MDLKSYLPTPHTHNAKSKVEVKAVIKIALSLSQNPLIKTYFNHIPSGNLLL
ncbi:hypothetical protein [Anabaena catenula]|uniref:Uncharacterized protein n=1 Tax=Anabaena catenula FACHB-362 TaxID=2692877 RepID=A0ABR8J911_9NOST|nr:hypothetical protein [Anabaena catenula]MBD2694053.1 hypothetical protein [Anabaena catenula FACHB-362]